MAKGGELTITIANSILLVKDEDSVRRMRCSMLKSLGYALLEASSPKESLSHCEKWRDRIDLVLTDVVMPGMNGRELYAKIETIRLGIKAIFRSCYTSVASLQHAGMVGGVNFLQKPFSRSILSKKIRSVLWGE